MKDVEQGRIDKSEPDALLLQERFHFFKGSLFLTELRADILVEKKKPCVPWRTAALVCSLLCAVCFGSCGRERGIFSVSAVGLGPTRCAREIMRGCGKNSLPRTFSKKKTVMNLTVSGPSKCSGIPRTRRLDLRERLSKSSTLFFSLSFSARSAVHVVSIASILSLWLCSPSSMSWIRSSWESRDYLTRSKDAEIGASAFFKRESVCCARSHRRKLSKISR